MAILRNLDYRTYKKFYECRIPFIYGAGGTLKEFDDSFFRNTASILKRADGIYDRSSEKTGKTVVFCGKKFEIAGITALRACAKKLDVTHIMILMIQESSVLEVMEFLDRFAELDNLICLSFFDIIKWEFQKDDEECFVPERQNSKQYIPKKIHYCWFGEKQIPEKNLRYIDSWKKYCGDYEIKRWGEDNYPLSETPQYVRDAYRYGKYSFVSDYARLDILYHEGGIYLDTDMELFRNFDQLLGYKAFWAFEHRNLIASGLGIGCEKGDDCVSDLRKLYQKAKFVSEKGHINLIACPLFQTAYFQFLGVEINDTTQVMDNRIFLSSHYLCSFNQDDGRYLLNDNTIGLHHYDCSWFDEEEKKRWDEKKEAQTAFNARIYNDHVKTIGEK